MKCDEAARKMRDRRIRIPIVHSLFSALHVCVVVFTLLLASQNAIADLSLARPFGDHMIVQRDVQLPVWGKVSARQSVEVRLGDQTRATTADERGDWRVAFPARPASAVPVALTVKSGEAALTVRDILVGEVWLCAGQSNMEWPVSSSASAKNALASADRPKVRLLNYRGAARGGAGRYSATVLEKLTAEAFCEGKWQVCSTESAGPFSAVGYYFGVELHRRLRVPIGLINVSIGGTPAEAWVRREALAAHPQLKSLVQDNWLHNEQLGEWCRERGTYNLSLALKNGSTIPGDDLGPNHSFKPAFMWEAAVAPLAPYPIRGVVWYQGESNAQLDWRVRQHRAIFELLVTDWRRQFGQGDFPFLYVQLPAMGREHWPEFRDQQRRLLDHLPNVGMAVTIDLGHPTNVHPTSKKPVGQRLAHWALANVYGQNEVVGSGPLFRSMKIEGRQVTLKFDSRGRGLQTRDGLPLRHFEIAGADGVYYPASANLRDGKVIVTSELVPEPQHVRYGWTPFPTPSVNFYNRNDLPASPFSTQTPAAYR